MTAMRWLAALVIGASALAAAVPAAAAPSGFERATEFSAQRRTTFRPSRPAFRPARTNFRRPAARTRTTARSRTNFRRSSVRSTRTATRRTSFRSNRATPQRGVTRTQPANTFRNRTGGFAQRGNQSGPLAPGNLQTRNTQPNPITRTPPPPRRTTTLLPNSANPSRSSGAIPATNTNRTPSRAGKPFRTAAANANAQNPSRQQNTIARPGNRQNLRAALDACEPSPTRRCTPASPQRTNTDANRSGNRTANNQAGLRANYRPNAIDDYAARYSRFLESLSFDQLIEWNRGGLEPRDLSTLVDPRLVDPRRMPQYDHLGRRIPDLRAERPREHLNLLPDSGSEAFAQALNDVKDLIGECMEQQLSKAQCAAQGAYRQAAPEIIQAAEEIFTACLEYNLPPLVCAGAAALRMSAPSETSREADPHEWIKNPANREMIERRLQQQEIERRREQTRIRDGGRGSGLSNGAGPIELRRP